MKICDLKTFDLIVQFLFVWGFCLSVSGHGSSPNSKVLLVSFDGFRYDYFDLAEQSGIMLTNFKKIFQIGIKADHLENVFLTRTFPNHMSIVTGCFEETHGIIDNSFFDPLFNETFSNRNLTQSIDWKWFSNSEPIWLTNMKHGHESAVIYWPGQLAPFNNKHFPTFSFGVYNSDVPLNFKIDLVLNWLSRDRTTLGILYHFQPDSSGHQFGPSSQDVLDQLKQLDDSIGYLLTKIESMKLEHRLNVIIVSDHGMTDISNERRVFLDDYIDRSLYNQYHEESYAFWGLWPVSGVNTSRIVESLKSASHVEVYRKNEIPKDWHFSSNRRIAPIVVVAEEGWAIVHNATDRITARGTHGYPLRSTRSNMHGIFVAWGPDFVSTNQSGIVVRLVDVFPLIAKLLKLENIPAINGSLANVHWMLDHGGSGDMAVITSLVIICSLSLFGALTACIIVSCAHYNSTALRVQKIGNTYVLKSGNLVRKWQQKQENLNDDKNITKFKHKKYLNSKTKITEADAAFLLESNDEDEILGDVPSSNYKFSS